MEIIADILLAAGAGAASFYCFILSRRLRQLADLDSGVGAAVARLSVQVDQLTKALNNAQVAAKQTNSEASTQAQRAEDASRKLELMLASLHDLEVERQPAKDLQGRSW